LFDLRDFLFPGFLFDSEFFRISSFIFHVVIFNSYTCLYIVLCFTLVFVEVLSEFIYLFLSLLMFFIFGVLKFRVHLVHSG
jgi:hypothetical protein